MAAVGHPTPDQGSGPGRRLPQLRPELLAVIVDAELVVVDPDTRSTHVLGGSAVAVWAALELHGGQRVSLVEALESVLEHPPDRSELAHEADRVLSEFGRLELFRHDDE